MDVLRCSIKLIKLTDAGAACGETLWLPRGGSEVAYMELLANLVSA